VILDLRMPRVDGLEVAAAMRLRDPERTVPLLVLTATGGAADWQKLSAMGADGFLVKPVRLPDVITLVRRALGERRSSTSLPPAAT
jgi:eukaryotic-like serine/threonine-protein kinase